MNTLLPFPPKTLGIDYGTRRIGLAATFGSLVEPLGVIANHADQVQVVTPECLANISHLIAQEKIEQIVVGLSESEMAAKTQVFVELLKAHLNRLDQKPMPIFFWDETLTSQAAQKKLNEQKINRPTLDQYAAAEMLTEWLDSAPKTETAT